MKILVIEDDIYKREQITNFLDSKAISYNVTEYLNSALNYIYENTINISGIILDLGLPIFENDPDTYSLYRGLEVIYELDRKKINIPVLINSNTFVGMLDEYPFVYAQRTKINNYQMLEDFVSFLTKREEQ